MMVTHEKTENNDRFVRLCHQITPHSKQFLIHFNQSWNWVSHRCVAVRKMKALRRIWEYNEPSSQVRLLFCTYSNPENQSERAMHLFMALLNSSWQNAYTWNIYIFILRNNTLDFILGQFQLCHVELNMIEAITHWTTQKWAAGRKSVYL